MPTKTFVIKASPNSLPRSDWVPMSIEALVENMPAGFNYSIIAKTNTNGNFEVPARYQTATGAWLLFG